MSEEEQFRSLELLIQQPNFLRENTHLIKKLTNRCKKFQGREAEEISEFLETQEQILDKAASGEICMQVDD